MTKDYLHKGQSRYIAIKIQKYPIRSFSKGTNAIYKFSLLALFAFFIFLLFLKVKVG